MAQKTKKVIITCAVTGSVHTPTMSPYLPITPNEIAEQSIGAAEAGASIIHLHARDPKDGRPTADPAVFMQFLPRIKQGTNAVLNITTGGGLGMSLEDRMAAAVLAEPEVATLSMGSFNVAFPELADRHKDWKYAWEEPFIRATEDTLFKNSVKDISTIARRLAKCGTRFEMECYDISHLYNLKYLAEREVVKPPFFIQFVFGLRGGSMMPEPEHLVHVKNTADKLFGDDYIFSVLAAGRDQIPMGTIAVIMGGCVRVGMEDSLYLTKGVLAKSNAEQVAKIRTIIEDLSLEVATPDDAREMLQLKGGDKVGF